MKSLLSAPRPDHTPPAQLDDAALAQAIESLRRKRQSVHAALRGARLGGGFILLLIVAGGFTLLWVGPEPFLPRIFQNGSAVTVPELLVWWTAVIAVSLFAGAVGTRLFQHRLRTMRAWRRKADELDRRLEDAEHEAGQRGLGVAR